MTVERWEISPSSMPDRYILKVRGDRADVDKLVKDFARVCQDVKEMSDPVFQWAVVMVGATLSERLSIQDHMREMAKPANVPPPKPMQSVDLSGVLSELSMVLNDITGLTEEEQAFISRKREERQERKSRTLPPMMPMPAAPPPPPKPAEKEKEKPKEEAKNAPMPEAAPKFAPFPPTPAPAAPAPSTAFPDVKSAPAEPKHEIVHDVAPPPRSVEKPAAKPTPAPAPEKPAVPAAAAPSTPPPPPPPPVSPPTMTAPAAPPPSPATPPIAAPAPAAAPVATPAAASSPADKVPADQLIKAACFFAPGADALKDSFFSKLTEVSQKKAKKPFVVQPVLTKATPISNKLGVEWAQAAKGAGAEVVFILLPPDLGPEFLEQAVMQLEMNGLHGYLITPAEVETRLLYVDLTVELMMIKRHK